MHRTLAGLALAAAAPIPWLAQRPVVPARPLAPPCRAGELRARLGLQGATGSLVGGAVLRMAGPGACSLSGRSTAHFAGHGAERVRLRVRAMAPGPVEASAPPRTSLRALRRGEEAWVGLSWSNWCGARRPAALVLALPRSGGELRVPTPNAPRCDLASAGSSLGIQPFSPLATQPSPASRLPLRATIPAARYSGRRGHALRFEVVLRNVSRRPFRFGDCPTYVEQLDPGAPFERYFLNCRPAGTLAPGTAATFAMIVHVPARAHAGPHGLIWQLAPATYEPPVATARVLVVR